MCRVCVRLLHDDRKGQYRSNKPIWASLLRYIEQRGSAYSRGEGGGDADWWALVVARPVLPGLDPSQYAYVNLIYQSTYCMLDENWEEQGELFYEKESLLDSSGGSR